MVVLSRSRKTRRNNRCTRRSPADVDTRALLFFVFPSVHSFTREQRTLLINLLQPVPFRSRVNSHLYKLSRFYAKQQKMLSASTLRIRNYFKFLDFSCPVFFFLIDTHQKPSLSSLLPRCDESVYNFHVIFPAFASAAFSRCSTAVGER